MISELNGLIDEVEVRLAEDLDVPALARRLGTTEYHLRRMFSSLVGMPLSEYVRRRPMTVAAADVLADVPLLDVAVRYGYGSTEALNRAFRAVHGISPAELRQHGGPLRSQPQLSDSEPAGLLQVSADVDPDFTEGSTLTYLHGVAIDRATAVPDDLDVIDVPAGSWVVFRSSGPYPEALQETYAASAADWFPSNPWRLREGPSIVAVIDRAEDVRTATTELWMPIERQA